MAQVSNDGSLIQKASNSLSCYCLLGIQPPIPCRYSEFRTKHLMDSPHSPFRVGFILITSWWDENISSILTEGAMAEAPIQESFSPEGRPLFGLITPLGKLSSLHSSDRK